MDVLNALQAFVAVARERGFAPAARSFGVATSSVTRQIGALEAHLGTTLLNRSTRDVTLTPAGERYLVRATRILLDVEYAHRSISEMGGAPRGLLRVSLPTVFGRRHVSPLVPEFLEAFADIQLDLVFTDRRVKLVEDRIDVAVRLGRLAESGLIARRLAGHHRKVCASPGYLDRHGVPAEPTDLVRHRCLTFSDGGTDHTWHFSKDGAVQPIEVAGPLRANDSETLKEAALSSVGLILMPTWLVGRDIASGGLVEVLADWNADTARASTVRSSEAGIYALYLPDRKTSPKVRAFVDFLAMRFGTPPEWDAT